MLLEVVGARSDVGQPVEGQWLCRPGQNMTMLSTCTVLYGSGDDEEECELEEHMDMVGAGQELLTNCEGSSSVCMQRTV